MGPDVRLHGKPESAIYPDRTHRRGFQYHSHSLLCPLGPIRESDTAKERRKMVPGCGRPGSHCNRSSELETERELARLRPKRSCGIKWAGGVACLSRNPY